MGRSGRGGLVARIGRGGRFDAHPAIIAANRPSIACNKHGHFSWRVGIVAPMFSPKPIHTPLNVLESIAKKLTFKLKAGLWPSMNSGQ